MQCPNVWAVDNCGSVQLYDIKQHEWRALCYQKIEFKRVCASPLMVWSVGGDHQIYVYVPNTDIPIRVCVTTYENQRWNPITSFSSTLLLTDRSNFSSEDGCETQTKESFALPSKSWQWESEWYIENNVEGEPLGPEGWTYAIDFPLQFTADHRWNSLVRRRKWVRYRRYVAVNQWALIDSIFGDFVAEPFIDISCGGYDLPGGCNDRMAVWAVTVIGRVMFRSRVEKLSPEGECWLNIDVPSGWEVNQVSCGPTGLTWAVAWDGSALVRYGVTRDNLMGVEWIRVEAPDQSKLMQVSVGVDTVWAITRDGRVWFRKGIRGLNSGHNSCSAVGSGWVEMMHKMAILSVTANDQVWAISADRKCLFYRSGITYGELTGKAWKLVPQMPNNSAQTNAAQHSDNISISSEDSSCAIQDNENMGWIWLSASSCTLNSDPYFQFSTSTLGSQGCLSVASSGIDTALITDECEWRTKILTLLTERYEKEMKDYMSSYQQAIESGTWIKSGTCFVGSKRDSNLLNFVWYLGFIELERKGVESGTDSGTLTISYSLSSSVSASEANSKVKKVILNLAEIMCVLYENSNRLSSVDLSSDFCVVITTKTNENIALKFRTDNEFDDWLATINIACGDLYGINGVTATSDAVLWGLTQRGDVYIGHQKNNNESELFFYHLCGGHFREISACGRVVWALSDEGILWVHTGGYGGGIYKGITGANSNCNPVTDTIPVYCYENQRWNPLMGFASKGLPTDRYMWSDESGRIELIKDKIKLPSRNWHWITDWNVDFNSSDSGVDSNGWQYAIDFPFEYHSERRFTDYVRRRRWYRRCQLNTTGPWSDLSNIPLTSISVHSPKLNSAANNNNTDDVMVFGWAVSSQGDALCRIGVSPICPRGLSWQHVPCEQRLTAISVGGERNSVQVWAIARDGSAFLRHGINEKCVAGTVWFHIEPPRSKCLLKQISVGLRSVWAVDDHKKLWFREEIVPTFPEGTHWIKAEDNVQQLCARKTSDEVWALFRKFEDNCCANKLAKCAFDFESSSDDRNNKFGSQWKYVNNSLNSLRFICCTVNCCDFNNKLIDANVYKDHVI